MMKSILTAPSWHLKSESNNFLMTKEMRKLNTSNSFPKMLICFWGFLSIPFIAISQVVASVNDCSQIQFDDYDLY